MNSKIMTWLNFVAVILLLVQASWAPTCGGGSTGTIYYINSIGDLGLPEQVSSSPVISIFNMTTNSSIAKDLEYRCYSDTGCRIFAVHHDYYPASQLQNTSKVLIIVNGSGSEKAYYADLRYGGIGNSGENCGGPVYWIENITPANSSDSAVIMIVLVLIVAICVGLFFMRGRFKNITRKAKRG